LKIKFIRTEYKSWTLNIRAEPFVVKPFSLFYGENRDALSNINRIKNAWEEPKQTQSSETSAQNNAHQLTSSQTLPRRTREGIYETLIIAILRDNCLEYIVWILPVFPT
jgi:hypothetical protein